MRFACDKCSAKYSIADEKVFGKLTSVRCIKCGNKIIVDGKALDAESSRPAIAGGGWFAIIDRKQLGPLSASDVQSFIEQGKIHARTYVWKEGQGDWKRAGETQPFKELFSLATSNTNQRQDVKVPDAKATKEFRPACQTESASHTARQEPENSTPEDSSEQSTSHYTDSVRVTSKSTLIDSPFQPPSRYERKDQTPDSLAPSPSLENRSESLSSHEESSDLSQNSQEPPNSEAASSGIDPFAQIEENSSNRPLEFGEQTRLFMQEAGVTRRNPAWKVIVFATILIGTPTATLYLLSKFNVGFLKITTRVDEKTGQEVKASVFSSEGLVGLRDMLLGRDIRPEPPRPKQKPGKLVINNKKPTSRPTKMSPIEQQVLKDKYGNDQLLPVGPKLLTRDDVPYVNGQALDQKIISSVFRKNIKAFQSCVETEIRRNPSFKGGKVIISFTIGSSGVVTHSSVNRTDIDRTSLGTCLKQKARQMVFPSFEGDPFEVQSPLFLAHGG